MSDTDLTPDTFKPLLKKLVSEPDSFTADDAQLAFEHLLQPESCTSAQIGSFLTLLHTSGTERRPEILAAAAKVLKKWCKRPQVERGDGLVADIVGTGGDGHDTFNVSTSAAIIAAGAGLRICKHGNKAATSTSGSADLLVALDCPLSGAHEQIPADGSLPFVFLLAPHYHQSLAPLAPIRRSLPFRTILNLLGPLVNPAEPDTMILGVPKREMGQVFAEALRDGGAIRRAMVVCGMEGLDEISCAGGTWVWEIAPDKPIEESSIHPSDFGLPSYPLEIVKGGSAHHNATLLERLLKSEGNIPEELGPILDFVLLNASALLVVGGLAKDYKEGVQLAKEAVRKGKAWTALTKFRKADQARR